MNPIFPKLKQLLCLALTALLVCSMMPFQAMAAQENTSKEEVVYINLNAQGEVEEINVVNIFDLAQKGTIVDYGEYESLRNMTGTSAIDYHNGVITVQADAGKLYYEGKLSSNEIPWNIAIDYYIDGKQYTAEDVAGRSGALKIVLDITRNEKYQGNFFDAFALQVSLTLDTAKCSNIIAPDATVANVGSSKQLTHTVLPGQGAHLEITADVVDFTMDGIAINGIPLNLKVEVDNEVLMNEVDRLISAIAQLDDGASSLHEGISSLQAGAQSGLSGAMKDLTDGTNTLADGAAELRDGATALTDGAKDLKSGAATLNDGIQTLNDGIGKMQTILNLLKGESSNLAAGSDAYLAGLTQLQTTLNSIAVTNSDISALVDASAKVLEGLTQLASGAAALEENVSFAALKAVMAEKGLDVDMLVSNNANAMAALRTAIDENKPLQGFLSGMGYDISGLFDQLEQVILLLGANNAFINGTGTYLDTVNSNLSDLAYNAALLQTNYAVFDSEISKLATLLGSLAENMTALTNAVNTLVAEYRKLDSGMDAYAVAMAEIVTAYADIANGSALLATGGAELKAGASDLYQGTSDLLSGIVQLSQGAVTLRDGSVVLNNGITELLTGIAKLYDGSSQLEDGTSNFRDETEGMDSTITNQIDDMLSQITGENVAVSSFVAEENTNVDAVQFVIRTAAIEHHAQTENVADDVQELTFWQKLLKLFGLLD